MPDYEGRIAFVDTITSDPAAQDVLNRYPGRYIPTSVFVGANGEVVDTYIGPLTEKEMRERLDGLAAGAE